MPLYFALALALGVGIGYFFTFRDGLSTGVTTYHGKSRPNKINNLLDYIVMQYVDTVNRQQLENKTILSMLKSLDPHSDFIPAEDFSTVNEPLEGNFDGIGVEFNILNDTVRVVTPIIGGPSEKLGIKAGDRIIRVNGKSIAGMKITNKQVFGLLRGKSGSQETVSILRAGVNNPLNFTITRGKIPLLRSVYSKAKALRLPLKYSLFTAALNFTVSRGTNRSGTMPPPPYTILPAGVR